MFGGVRSVGKGNVQTNQVAESVSHQRYMKYHQIQWVIYHTTSSMQRCGVLAPNVLLIAVQGVMRAVRYGPQYTFSLTQ